MQRIRRPYPDEVGGQRGTCYQALFQPPLPEPDLQLSLHPALQLVECLLHFGSLLTHTSVLDIRPTCPPSPGHPTWASCPVAGFPDR